VASDPLPTPSAREGVPGLNMSTQKLLAYGSPPEQSGEANDSNRVGADVADRMSGPDRAGRTSGRPFRRSCAEEDGNAYSWQRDAITTRPSQTDRLHRGLMDTVGVERAVHAVADFRSDRQTRYKWLAVPCIRSAVDLFDARAVVAGWTPACWSLRPKRSPMSNFPGCSTPAS
jgi:hypothetical protein